MCFSAKVSFLTSLLLSVIGIFTLQEVKQKNQKLFAFIPILFALQQFSEGIVWITIQNLLVSEFLKKLSMYFFLIFALIIWPFWIPLSILKLEKNAKNKKMLFVSLAFGILWSIMLSLILIFYGAKVSILHQHIYYEILSPFVNFQWIAFLLYNLSTILPFFLSSKLTMWIFGILVLISCIITYFFWGAYLVSVWCFFASILSTAIYSIIKWQNFKFDYEQVLKKYIK